MSDESTSAANSIDDLEMVTVKLGKKLSLRNGQINNMKKHEIIAELQHLRLNSFGNKEVLKRRLKDHYKKVKLAPSRSVQKSKVYDRFYDYICVLDFECTCLEGQHPNFPHEIIEFPVILLKTSSLEIIDEFHAYCKPRINPALSSFCTFLTGIQQSQVDAAKPFNEVFEDFMLWMKKHELGTTFGYALATDGPWDIGKFLQLQFQHMKKAIPHEFRYWINIRKLFANFYKIDRLNMRKMLAALQLDFEGREHSGLDDSRNLTRIVQHLFRDGAELRINERLIRRDKRSLVYDEPGKDTANPKKDVATIAKENERREEGLGPASSENPLGLSNCAFFLPYAVVPVSKQDFLSDKFEECFTCDENEDVGNNG